MPSGRSYSWHTHQSDGPVIIEREPNVRTRRPARPHQKPKTLIFGFKFVNPFTSKKPSVPVVRQQICRRPRGPDRVEVVEVREPTREPGGSREPTPMSRGGRHEELRREAEPLGRLAQEILQLVRRVAVGVQRAPEAEHEGHGVL